MSRRLDISVVVPIYNEEESLPYLYRHISVACHSLGCCYEIIMIDDGSRDKSFDVLTALHAQDRAVKVVRFRKNYGQTAAMAAGFRLARGKTIVSMDGDLQNDPADIPRLLAKLEEGYDVVCGWRKERQDKLISRRIPSVVANWLIAKITGVPIHDNGCSLKAYRSDVIKRVALYSELHRFIPAMTTLFGARIAEIVVRHHARKFGTSKYGLSRTWGVFSDLFVIKMLTGFAARPALWFGTLSLPALVLGAICLSASLLAGVSGLVLPSASFLFFAWAGHFLAMGVLGEMLLKTGDYRPEVMLAIGACKRN